MQQFVLHIVLGRSESLLIHLYKFSQNIGKERITYRPIPRRHCEHVYGNIQPRVIQHDTVDKTKHDPKHAVNNSRKKTVSKRGISFVFIVCETRNPHVDKASLSADVRD